MRQYKTKHFTKRHYELFAGLLAKWYIDGITGDVFEKIVRDFVAIFSLDNELFDEEKFLNKIKKYIQERR